MKKRMTSLVLTIALLVSLGAALATGASAVADSTFRPLDSSRDTNIIWRLTTDGYLLIIVDNPLKEASWPDNWAYNGAPWYNYRDSIKSVTIGDGISSIGNYAFYGCTSLAMVSQYCDNVNPQHGVTHIGDYAFSGCVGLTQIEFIGWTTGILEIGRYAFNDCVNLTGLQTDEASVIGEYAFNGCVGLTEMYLNSAVEIYDYAFRGCTGLALVKLPGIMNYVGEGVFAGCRSLATIDVSNTGIGTLYLGVASNNVGEPGVLYCIFPNYNASNNTVGWEARIIKAEANLPSTYNIAGGYDYGTQLTRIDVEAFAYQSNLDRVTIPSSVSNIGLNAFSWCNNLKEAYFRGHAPTVPQVPNVAQNARIFENVANGFVIYFDYFPTVSSTGWPTPPAKNWRGYTAIANTSFVLIEPSTMDNPYTPVVTTIEQGYTTQLRATVYPLNSKQDVRWESSDPAVATVSSDGVVHALSPGETIVKATTADGSRFAERRVHVLERIVPVTSVTLDKTQMTLVTDDPPASGLITAIIHPSNAAPAPALTWKSSDTRIAFVDLLSPAEPHKARIVAVSPGTVSITVTVKTENGEIISAPVVVTVVMDPFDPSMFVPVTNITLDPANPSVPMGGKLNLREMSTVWPENATNNLITGWEVIHDLSTIIGASITDGSEGGVLTVPWLQTGTVVVEATVGYGLSDEQWGYGIDVANVNYTQRFTINVTPFEPIIDIRDVTSIAHVGIPLKLRGTVMPYDMPIEWSIKDPGETGAYIDPVSGLFVAQNVGTALITASVTNGILAGTDTLTGGALVPYEETFTIFVIPYNPHALVVRSDPGGMVSFDGSTSVSGEISGVKAVGQVIEITASANTGYVFAGWYTSNGGTIKEPNSADTEFTMPDNATTVTAFFSYVGVTGGWTDGAVVLPTPSHYFVSGSRYVEGSTAEFAHVTQRDFQLFSYVTLDGKTLTKDGHYTAERLGNYTKVTFINGYLDTLDQGSHTLIVYFTDKVTVTAVFTIVRTGSSSTYQPEYTAQLYDDVRSTDWFFSDVAFVSERGWMTSNTSDPRLFRPNASATQGEIVDALYRMSGSPSVQSTQGRSLHGREASLEWALQNSITPVGGTISVNSPITRQDLALVMYRLVSANKMSLPEVRGAPNFSDEWSIAPSVRNAVTALYRAGIIDGRTANAFVPQGNVTRAELAAILTRFSTAMN